MQDKHERLRVQYQKESEKLSTAIDNANTKISAYGKKITENEGELENSDSLKKRTVMPLEEELKRTQEELETNRKANEGQMKALPLESQAVFALSSALQADRQHKGKMQLMFAVFPQLTKRLESKLKTLENVKDLTKVEDANYDPKEITRIAMVKLNNTCGGSKLAEAMFQSNAALREGLAD